MWAEDHGGCEGRKINERNVRKKKKKPDPMSRVKDMHHIPLAIACERLDENLEKTNGKNNLKNILQLLAYEESWSRMGGGILQEFKSFFIDKLRWQLRRVQSKQW